ncbi:MAG: hypothetical protein HKN11_07135 [Rhizobiales bacterium]|nr:hypothetical protein [Hyphomicrobiales bacterium]
MQRRTKFILASATAGILGLAAVGGAIAGHRHQGGMGMHGGMHGGGHGGMHGSGHGGTYGSGHGMREHGWGKRGRGHGMRHRVKQFAKRYDTDKNGEISQQEIDTNRTDWHKKFDADSNGTIDLKEFEALWLEAKRRRMARAFQRLDEDASGTITLEEYTEPMARIVERLDRNGDGVLSRKDMKHRRMHRQRGMDTGSEPKDTPDNSSDQ